jgi:hypothetical protein
VEALRGVWCAIGGVDTLLRRESREWIEEQVSSIYPPYTTNVVHGIAIVLTPYTAQL